MTEFREREDRMTEERRARFERSESTIDGSQRLKLAIPPDVAERLARDGEVPRWVNDEGNRMHNLTVLDAYDRVEGVAPVPVGTNKEGKPIKAYLCSIPKQFLDERSARKEAPRREMEEALERGNIPNDPGAGGDTYAVEGNRISRGVRSP